MNTRQKGTDWEKIAAGYLTKQGMRIVEHSFRQGKRGEIDLIGYHNGYLVFVEVKYRAGTEKGSAVAAVNLAKQRQICMVADYYRSIHNLGDGTPVRYDVVAIQGEEIQWLQNAFLHHYRRRW